VSALIACASAFVIVSIYYWKMQPVMPLLAELVTTVAIYVFAIFALGTIHHRIVGPLRSDI
jgi:hypothetical protein